MADHNASDAAASGEIGFATRLVHAGDPIDAPTGAVAPPIHLASTYAQDAVGDLRAGFEYSRSGNPTRAKLETTLAELEGATHGAAFASGLSALDTVLRCVPDGGAVLCSDDAYGGTLRLLGNLHVPRLQMRVADLTDRDAYLGHLDDVALVIAELPTNPLLRIVDIATLADDVHAAGGRLVIDATFATPWNTRPLSLGADVVVHSTTKYLGGHSDVVGGAVLTSDDALAERIGFIQNAAGAVPAPFDCYLVLRGLRTLGVRMERGAANAARVAEFLAADERVAHVNFPGLTDHPQHELATAQMRTPGAMVSFEPAEGVSPRVVVESTDLFTLAESLGAVESLIELPVAMTHASLLALREAGVAVAVPPEGLVRLSVGIEDADDLIGDLDRALTKAVGA